MDAGRVAWIDQGKNAPHRRKTRNRRQCRSLIPGLINSHVHLANDGPAGLFEQVVNACAVTTVRDYGGAKGIAIELGKAAEAGPSSKVPQSWQPTGSSP